MSNQDLGWVALQPETMAAKLRKGYSNNILVASSDYFQAITSFAPKGTDVVYAGIKKSAKNSEGSDIADIAKVHEYGSLTGNIPARPLWGPTLKEVLKWLPSSNTNPAKIFEKRIKRYL